ncbi:MAG TPA: DUF3034 family protein, partial [Thioalkalivibrio sp.]|nr:DUF3034 family protein [Thioalkalivibrio sp.]
MNALIKSLSLSLALLLLLEALAMTQAPAGGRLLAPGGATQLEGAAGGGIVPWAVIAGYGTEDEWGADLSLSHVRSRDLALNVASVSAGFANRLELSAATQALDVDPLDLQIRQDVFGAKLRLTGDLVYTAMPQISAGIQYKRVRDFDVPRTLGARD